MVAVANVVCNSHFYFVSVFRFGMLLTLKRNENAYKSAKIVVLTKYFNKFVINFYQFFIVKIEHI
jgi:hypothetical protein